MQQSFFRKFINKRNEEDTNIYEQTHLFRSISIRIK